MPLLSQRFDSDLGRWLFTEWRPEGTAPLAGVVERVWDFEGQTATPRERVFPNGLIEIIVQLDACHLDVHESGMVPTPATCVTGLHSQAFVIEAPRRPNRVIGIRLTPLGAWMVLRHPLHELSDSTVDLRDLLGRAAHELAALCHDAGSGGARLRRVHGWLERRLATASAGDAGVRWVAGSIARSAGNTAIAPLRAQLGWSGSRLASLFRQQVGVTPKRYARILRFNRALTLLDRRDASLAEVALAAGYFDQAHMNAEFRTMAALTPREYLLAKRYPDSVNLAERHDGMIREVSGG